MTDIWAIALGMIVFALWISFMAYYSSTSRAYTQGRIDQIRHKNRCLDYKGLAAFFYRQGRKSQAKRHRIKVHSKMAGRGYGNPFPH